MQSHFQYKGYLETKKYTIFSNIIYVFVNFAFLCNKMKNSFCTLIYGCFFSLIIIVCQDLKPQFRILAPQFICSSDKSTENSTDTSAKSSPGITTIRLQAASGQELVYNWTVRFNVLNGPRGQRFNLLVWRAVRNLEKILTNMSPEIASTNTVNINNSLLVEGVNYVFKISGINNKHIVSDTRSFTVKFQDANSEPKFNIEGSGIDKQFSVLMLGSDVTYVDMQYEVEAHVTPCKPTNDYYFVWNVSSIQENIVLSTENLKGKRLVILPGLLIAGYEYDIHCSIFKISDNSEITSKGIFLTTKFRGISVTLNVNKLVVAINSPINLQASFKNSDNVPGKITINWNCIYLSKTIDCEYFIPGNDYELNLERGFENEGEYQIEVKISKGNYSTSQKCTIIVKNGMIPTIDVDSVSILAISGQPLEVPTRVSDLRPNCNLNWVSVKEDGYLHLNADFDKYQMNNELIVHSKDETFLSEIAEFSNETLSKNFPLVIPGKSLSWPGLEPDAKYKFRLLVKCSCSLSIECEGPKNITAFSDIVVQTNKPPVPKPLRVKPPSGFALKTIFQFATSSATDLLSDYPLTYIFGFRMRDNIYIIKKFTENLVTETILPFSTDTLIPFLKVCDSRDACSKIEGSPLETIKYVLQKDELDIYKDIFKYNIFRNEYFDGFFLITMILETFKEMNESKLLQEFLMDVENFIKKDIEKQIDNINRTSDIRRANEFIDIITTFIKKFPISDSLIQDILQLRDIVFDFASQKSIKIEKRNISYGNESIRIVEKGYSTKSIYKRDLSSDDVENLLKVSEYVILKSKNDEQIKKEKENVLSKINKSLKDSCKNENKQVFLIDTQIVSASIEKINFKSKYNLYVPYTYYVGAKINNSIISELQINPKEYVKLSNLYCVAKSFYSIKIFIDDPKQIGFIYSSLIYDKASNELAEDFDVTLKIPVHQASGLNQVFKCSKWDNTKWNIDICQSNNRGDYIICKCNSFGFFSLYETEMFTSSTIPPEVHSNHEISNFSTLSSLSTTSILTTVKEISDSPNVISDAAYETIKNKENSSLIENSGSQKNAESIMISIFSFGIIGLLVLSIFFIIKKRRAKQLNNKMNLVEKVPKYRSFHAEHLMEGSLESLDYLKIQAK